MPHQPQVLSARPALVVTHCCVQPPNLKGHAYQLRIPENVRKELAGGQYTERQASGLGATYFFPPGICMCSMHACVLTCVCTCVCVCMGTQSREGTSPCFLSTLHIEVRSLTCRLSRQLSPGTPFLCLPSTGVTSGQHTSPAFCRFQGSELQSSLMPSVFRGPISTLQASCLSLNKHRTHVSRSPGRRSPRLLQHNSLSSPLSPSTPLPLATAALLV